MLYDRSRVSRDLFLFFSKVVYFQFIFWHIYVFLQLRVLSKMLLQSISLYGARKTSILIWFMQDLNLSINKLKSQQFQKIFSRGPKLNIRSRACYNFLRLQKEKRSLSFFCKLKETHMMLILAYLIYHCHKTQHMIDFPLRFHQLNFVLCILIIFRNIFGLECAVLHSEGYQHSLQAEVEPQLTAKIYDIIHDTPRCTLPYPLFSEFAASHCSHQRKKF